MKNSIKHILNKQLIPLVLCLFLVPSSLLAQTASVDEVINRALEQGIDQAQLQELQNRAQSRGITDQQLLDILEPALSLAENELPSETILQKALEGLSKGVPANRMLPVLQNMQRSVQQAGPMIENWVQRPNVQQIATKEGGGMSQKQFRNELIKAASRGLMNNVPENEMQGMLDEIGSDDLASDIDPSGAVASVGVFSELSASTQQPEVARSLVVRSLKGGFNTADMQRLPAAVRVAQQRSQLPAASVIEGVARQMSGGIPAKQILQNLFNGNVGGGPPGGTPPGLQNKQDRGNNGNNG